LSLRSCFSIIIFIAGGISAATSLTLALLIFLPFLKPGGLVSGAKPTLAPQLSAVISSARAETLSSAVARPAVRTMRDVVLMVDPLSSTRTGP